MHASWGGGEAIASCRCQRSSTQARCWRCCGQVSPTCRPAASGRSPSCCYLRTCGGGMLCTRRWTPPEQPQRLSSHCRIRQTQSCRPRFHRVKPPLRTAVSVRPSGCAHKVRSTMDAPLLGHGTSSLHVPWRPWRCATGIVLRKALKPLRIPVQDTAHGNSVEPASCTHIPAGRLVAISPFQLHHDPRFFRDPAMFDPTRHRCSAPDTSGQHRKAPVRSDCAGVAKSGHPAADVEVASGCKGAGQAAGLARIRVAFGAGPFRCPGRAFAIAEAALAVGIFFSCFNSVLSEVAALDGQVFADGASGRRRVEQCGTRAPGGLTGGYNHRLDAHASADGDGRDRGAGDDCHVHGRHGGWGGPLRTCVRAPPWLTPAVVPGEHVVARGVRSGDPGGCLPTFEPRLLVGVKKPIGSLWATC